MHEDFATFLQEKMKEHKLSIEALAQKTGIPESALEYLAQGELHKLPAAPYVHGYIVKLGELMDFDGENWWDELKRIEAPKSSGLKDALPVNRFSRNKRPRWIVWGLPIVALLLIVGGIRFASIVGLPNLAVTDPDRDGITVQEERFTFRGTTDSGNTVTINGEGIPVNPEGLWNKEILLSPGVNDITVEAKKFLGRSRSVSRRLILEPEVTFSTSTDDGTSTSTPSSTLNVIELEELPR